jgi:hypothetical protein
MAEPRRYGFPLQMLAGFAVGASIAVVAAFVLSFRATRFSYTGLFQLTASLGGMGIFVGHIIGAARNPDAGIKPIGPLSQGVVQLGGLILVGGSALVLFGVLGIMTLFKGPPPH